MLKTSAVICLLTSLLSFECLAFDTQKDNLASCLLQFQVNGKTTHQCSGTFISPTEFLTAAHCAYFGAAYIQNEELQTTVSCPFEKLQHRVMNAIIHPKFNSTLIKFDLAAIPPDLLEEFKKGEQTGVGGAVNTDMGLLNVDPETPFIGQTPTIALEKTEFKRLISGECAIRTFRGDLIKFGTEVNVDSEIYFRQVQNIGPSTNARFGLQLETLPLDKNISYGDSGGAVICKDAKNANQEVIVATISGMFSPAVSIYQNAKFLKFARKSDSLTVQNWMIPSAFNRELLASKKNFLVRSIEVKINFKLSTNCQTDILLEVARCNNYLEQTEEYLKSASSKELYFINNKVINFVSDSEYNSNGLQQRGEFRISLYTQADLPRWATGPVFDIEKVKRFISTPIGD